MVCSKHMQGNCAVRPIMNYFPKQGDAQTVAYSVWHTFGGGVGVAVKLRWVEDTKLWGREVLWQMKASQQCLPVWGFIGIGHVKLLNSARQVWMLQVLSGRMPLKWLIKTFSVCKYGMLFTKSSVPWTPGKFVSIQKSCRCVKLDKSGSAPVCYQYIKWCRIIYSTCWKPFRTLNGS